MKILLTGSTGYIGSRLLPVLLEQGHEVVCLLRDRRRVKLPDSLKLKVSFIEADLLYPEQLQGLPQDIDAAYYLVHSMGSGSTDFARLEEEAAQNFINSLRNTQARQLIYLGGISNDEQLSPHLKSRLAVEKILRSSSIPVTVLRAAIIIGEGSASFEIIRDLIEKLPLMICPRWVNTRCQPIAIHNVIEYLSGVLLEEQTYHITFDIGGPDILSYKDMLLQFAALRGLKRIVVSLPLFTPKLSSYWLYFITTTSYPLARSLVESMRNEVVMQDYRIREILPLRLLPYREAVRGAFDKIAQNEVISSWKDAVLSNRLHSRLRDFVEVPVFGCFADRRSRNFDKPVEQVLDNLWRIGGERGWYYAGFLWKLRGFFDRLFGGVGLGRGRRNPDKLFIGDSLDFWRVLVADREEQRLLLYAEMKVPGEAWLEFKIEGNKNEGHRLIQTATFRPEGVLGRLYWYAVLPFHFFLFEGMIRRIIQYEEKSQIDKQADKVESGSLKKPASLYPSV